MTLRRAAPWAVSLLAHAVLVLFVPLGTDLRGMRVPAPERRVVLEFDDADRPPTDAEPSPPPAPSIGAADLALPASHALPPAAPLDPVAEVPLSALAAAVAGGIPSPRDVLAALPVPSAPTATTAARADAATAEPSVRIGWTGTPRTVVRSVNPRFPRILSETGQEAETGARITVTPLGAVIDVEITRSSGYIEIDAAVETALRQWLFSRSEGKQNAVGTVFYRFPLERRD